MPAVLLDVRDRIAHVTLNRPEAYNAVSLELVTDLCDATLRCEVDRDVRAVIIYGAGKAFCAGGDLKTFAARLDEFESLQVCHLLARAYLWSDRASIGTLTRVQAVLSHVRP